MLIRLLQGGALLTLTVMVHAVLFTGMIEYLRKRHRDGVSLSIIAYAWLLARVAMATVLAHLLEIGLWAAFYVVVNAVPSLEAGFYFSSVTYATIGYGDVVLAPTWRLLAAMEGLTGILMCSWSGALFFAVVSKLDAETRLGTRN
jgi:hypothetical protein